MSTFPRQVQRFYESQFDRFDTQRRANLEAAFSDGQINRYVEECRASIRRIYRLPSERCELNTQVTGIIECDGYRIEKMHFESRHGLKVTANLYVPDPDGDAAHHAANSDGGLPCVLGSCGHSEIGKAEPRYQMFCAGLARLGFVVLIYDPISQGERVQFGDDKEAIGGCVGEHVTIGTKQSLFGDYFGSWRAWDGIRALDVLLERPEVDVQRVGMTGNSGGGTMTTIITALEDRLTMAAPSCFITTYRRNLQNELPADTEQTPPGIISAGHELYDHLLAAAPRPTLICTKEDDFFDHRGAEEAYATLSRVYDALGKSGDIEFATGVGGHGFDRDLREAMYAFFAKQAGIQADVTEPDIEVLEPSDLLVTPDRSVDSIESRHVLDFLREVPTPDRRAFDKERLRTLLAIPELPDVAPDYRILRNRDGLSRIAVETESDAFAMMTFGDDTGSRFRIPQVPSVELVLPHVDENPLGDGSATPRPASAPVSTEGSTGSSAADQPADTQLALAVRGTGESRYDTANGSDYFELYDADYMYSSHGIMMEIPLAGRKIFDVLRTVQLLESEGVRVTSLRGSGCGALIALYAAPFIEGLGSLTLTNCLESLREIVDANASRWPQSVLVPGMLEWFDLPDIVDHLREELGVHVRIEDPWGPMLTAT